MAELEEGEIVEPLDDVATALGAVNTVVKRLCGPVDKESLDDMYQLMRLLDVFHNNINTIFEQTNGNVRNTIAALMSVEKKRLKTIKRVMKDSVTTKRKRERSPTRSATPSPTRSPSRSHARDAHSAPTIEIKKYDPTEERMVIYINGVYARNVYGCMTLGKQSSTRKPCCRLMHGKRCNLFQCSLELHRRNPIVMSERAYMRVLTEFVDNAPVDHVMLRCVTHLLGSIMPDAVHISSDMVKDASPSHNLLDDIRRFIGGDDVDRRGLARGILDHFRTRLLSDSDARLTRA